jgi:predicted O-linked N-acetylglucosamine transferase (SPINDLY family)
VWYVYRPCIGNPEIRDTHEMLVQNAPAIKNGYITFGSLNNILKTTPTVIATWAEILKRVPNSRLLLICDDSERLREVLWANLEGHDIDKDRVIILNYVEKLNHYLFYNRIDIALDTFPYAGGTTTCDAVWMGVPVITKAGSVFRSRMGVTIANNVGHPEWVASDEKEYIEKAVLLGQDIEKLNTLRLGLRDEMEQSPLMDEVGFTVKLEQAYREMWVNYCNQGA